MASARPPPPPRAMKPFPWLLLGKLLGLLVGAGTVGLYLFRYGREAVLASHARRNDPRGAMNA